MTEIQPIICYLAQRINILGIWPSGICPKNFLYPRICLDHCLYAFFFLWGSLFMDKASRGNKDICCQKPPNNWLGFASFMQQFVILEKILTNLIGPQKIQLIKKKYFQECRKKWEINHSKKVNNICICEFIINIGVWNVYLKCMYS